MRTLWIAVAIVFAGMPARAQDIVGDAVALYGDAIIIGSTRVPLYGIDAPDADQDRNCTLQQRLFGCYSNAKRALEILVDQGPATCTPSGETNYLRQPYSVCTVAGVDLGQEMVRQGWALAFRPQTDVYAADEDAAREARLGLWQEGIRFAIPWEYREQFQRALFGD